MTSGKDQSAAAGFNQKFLKWLGSSSLTVFLSLAILVLLIPFASWLTSSRVETPPNVETVNFETALHDAMHADQEEVSSLVALDPSNSKLFWDSSPDASKVLVATWTSYSGYQNHVSGACSLAVEVWVTPVPQMQEACRSFGLSGVELGSRLEKYLGLALKGGRESVVEMWVSPDDLFRPCPDPEVDDRECQVGLPAISEDPSPQEIRHARWFQEQFQRYYGEGAGIRRCAFRR